ncbi:MAG: glycosyl transferase [gamma proteobacterium symbiont of Stewartia floridana]|nr:glycosyl transferase [Candidatus Thiodiazotropha taylori]RLW53627.1 MAG: glycosyl transferase [gamma proteobacterium symbiont of Stewartia floridana]MCG7868795.1 glycosyl transferase [Candidatus Thiodiazotropha taylori]MCG7916192.1 glycosyl transferase [Candidatus Thiodiazotropha taylori]MCG7942768.1 glycosyl transferase [Candidatus Thiodiazotropha taylori]
MADFFQHGDITTLHKLTERPLDEMEQELSSFASKKPIGLILPSLYSELTGPALSHIIDELQHASYISHIIIGLDRATESEFKQAQDFFARLPQRTHLLWQDGARLRSLDSELQERDLSPPEPGKGRNVWFCMGYALAIEELQAIGLHDCDIVTYSRELPARLLYPLAHPNFNFEYAKGYYARVNENKLSGRVTRLFVTPLLRALRLMVGPLDYLEYMDSFRYPLSGEFAMSRDLASQVRIPSDWGLEVGLLSEVYRNISHHQICQVDIADQYDHKHQDLSAEDRTGGLAKMSRDIAKSFYRKLATEGIQMNQAFFRSLKAAYLRKALDMVEMYYHDAKLNALAFNRHAEEEAIEVFQQSIVEAGQAFLDNPLEAPFIPNWKRVLSAMPDFTDRLFQAVAEDNR